MLIIDVFFVVRLTIPYSNIIFYEARPTMTLKNVSNTK